MTKKNPVPIKIWEQEWWPSVFPTRESDTDSAEVYEDWGDRFDAQGSWLSDYAFVRFVADGFPLEHRPIKGKRYPSGTAYIKGYNYVAVKMRLC